MVFPGRFSTGCLRCRQRKVKCDEARPSCRRCHIYGKPCTGYTDQFQFRHRRCQSSSSTASPAVSQESRGKGSASGRRRSSVHVFERTEQQQQTRQVEFCDQAVVRAPTPSYEDVSLFYFIRRFVSPNPADGYPGHLSSLPSLFNWHSQGLLEVATLSVAQMAAYNQFGGGKFRMQSYRNYGRAIRMLQDIIKSEDRATDDKVIMSILLLCMLKDISGEGSGDPNEHAPGLFYLIEKRGPEQITTSRGAELLFLALIRLQVYSFLHDDDSYVDPGAIATVWGAFDPLLRALGMMSLTLSLRHQLLASNRNAPLYPEEQETIIQTCFKTLDDFHLWDVEAATYWQSMFEQRKPPPTALGEVAAGTAHYDAETACTIILIRSARLILLISMITYHYQQQDTDPAAALLAECIPFLELDIGMAIDDMLASVPYALGDVGPSGLPGSLPHDGAAAIVIVHPIRLVASCAYTTPDRLQKAMDVLARFNAGMGIRAAVRLGEEDVSNTRWVYEQVFLRSKMATLSEPSCLGPSLSLSETSYVSASPSLETDGFLSLSPCSLVDQAQIEYRAVSFGCTIPS